MIRAARAFLFFTLAGVMMPTQCASVSVQILNPDEHTAIRVFLDRKVIYEGMPTRASLGVHGVLSIVAGTFELSDKGRHVLVAEVPSGQTKAQFEWMPQNDPSPWVVIRYYPGRPEPGEPSFFTFSLQGEAYRLR